MTNSRAVALAVALLASTLAGSVSADTDEQRAMALFDRGRKLAREGKCADAVPTLLESVKFVEGVGPLLNLGNCYELLGKTASAHRYFVRAQEIATARDDRRRTEAAARARNLETDLSFVTIHVPAALRSATTEARVDGEPWDSTRWDVPVPIDPGRHDIELVAPPNAKQSETIVVGAKGDHVEWTAKRPPEPERVTLRPPLTAVPTALPPAPDRPRTAHPRRTVAVVVGAAGVSGIIAGTVAGIVSLAAHSSVTGACPTYPHCAGDLRSTIETTNARASSAGTVATVGIVAGSALLVGAAALFVTAPAPGASE